MEESMVTTVSSTPARIRDPWGARTPYAAGEPWPVRVDVHLEAGWSEADVEWVPTAAVLHSNGDGLELGGATSAAALKASFGPDGQPGSSTDVDWCGAIALYGHNVAETQAVLWMRMLDRRRGSTPPAMIAVDPRDTPVAREADVHLAVRNGTNQAVMNALLHVLLANGWYDRSYVDDHT